MKTLNMYLDEQMKNEEFRKEWEENQPEMEIIRAMADARISQNLTQKELAERTGINHAESLPEAAEASGRWDGDGPETCVCSQKCRPCKPNTGVTVCKAPAPVQERGLFAYLPALFSLPIICFDKTMK